MSRIIVGKYVFILDPLIALYRIVREDRCQPMGLFLLSGSPYPRSDPNMPSRTMTLCLEVRGCGANLLLYIVEKDIKFD